LLTKEQEEQKRRQQHTAVDVTGDAVVHQGHERQETQEEAHCHPDRDHDVVVSVSYPQCHSPEDTQDNHDKGGANKEVDENHLEDGKVRIHLGNTGAFGSLDLNAGHNHAVGDELLVLEERDKLGKVELQNVALALRSDRGRVVLPGEVHLGEGCLHVVPRSRLVKLERLGRGVEAVDDLGAGGGVELFQAVDVWRLANDLFDVAIDLLEVVLHVGDDGPGPQAF